MECLLQAVLFISILVNGCLGSFLGVLVEKCPSESEWPQRSKDFKCSSWETYHCMFDDEGKLREACLKPETIHKGQRKYIFYKVISKMF